MSYGIILRVTHAGLNSSSIYIPDTHDGKDSNGRVQNQKSAQYVPVGGYVDMVFTDQIAFSYQQGGIRGLINEGYITTSFIVNTDVTNGLLYSSESKADAGVASLTVHTTYLTAVAAGDEVSLADGAEGQVKVFVLKTVGAGDDITVNVASAGWVAADAAGTILLDTKGQGCTLQFVSGAWYCIGNNGCTFA